ncbi:MAG: hypothetical protein ACRDDY_09535 [Clostridium sp.]|uniref:hypothetical protein n=1 Tax=Clostridium sp. TaxID=1506 RepID=UPI003EE756BA
MGKKRIISLIIGGFAVVALMGCGAKVEENKAEEKAQSRMVGENSRGSNLQGEWANKSYTYETFKEEGLKLSKKVKNLSEEFGLSVKEDEKVQNIDGITANIKSIYVENENPEENKLEGMNFSTEFLGESQEGGKFVLKMSLKFNGEGAIEANSFNLGDTSLAKYASILIGEENRDYTGINEKILGIIKSDSPDGIIEDSINGLHEEIAVSKEYLVYTLTTKEFQFEESDAPLE